jgi:hypothetical protein
VTPGLHFLRVSQDREPVNGEKPPVYENVSDTYSIRVAVAVPVPGEEAEPNDGLADGQDVMPGDLPIEAHIGWNGDRDTFCTNAEGRFAIVDRAASPGSPRLDVESFVAGASTGTSSVEDGWKSQRFGTGKHCVQIVGREGADLDEPYRVYVER